MSLPSLRTCPVIHSRLHSGQILPCLGLSHWGNGAVLEKYDAVQSNYVPPQTQLSRGAWLTPQQQERIYKGVSSISSLTEISNNSKIVNCTTYHIVYYPRLLHSNHLSSNMYLQPQQVDIPEKNVCDSRWLLTGWINYIPMALDWKAFHIQNREVDSFVPSVPKHAGTILIPLPGCLLDRLITANFHLNFDCNPVLIEETFHCHPEFLTQAHAINGS